MYTAYIGRRLLDLYNARRRQELPLNARAFFDKVFFPLFFDDERYLMLANNSKFDQKAKQKKAGNPAERREALASFHADVATLEEPLGHLFQGGYTAELERATSSQVTNLKLPVSSEEVYLSWFGLAAGIGVKGGLSMLVDTEEVLDAILEGWVQYRAYLRQTPVLKAYQIDTWNGWWLIHRFGEMYQVTDPLRDFPAELPVKNGVAAFDTPPWIRVLFALSSLEGVSRQMAYVYSFGQTNTTVGFVQLDLPRVQGLPALYERLFGKTPAFVGRQQFVQMYEPAYGFRRACEMGSIGLRALEPDKLRNFMPGGKNQLPVLSSGRNPHEQEVSFAIYQTWIIAMLNNEDLLMFADKAAEALHATAISEERGKTTNMRAVEEGVLKATNRRAFIEGLTELLEKDKDDAHAQTFNQLVTEIMKMPANDFPLLLTLIRFKYALRNRKADL
jgi:hypothetical protein